MEIITILLIIAATWTLAYNTARRVHGSDSAPERVRHYAVERQPRVEVVFYTPPVIVRPGPAMHVVDEDGRVWEVSYQKFARPVRTPSLGWTNAGDVWEIAPEIEVTDGMGRPILPPPRLPPAKTLPLSEKECWALIPPAMYDPAMGAELSGNPDYKFMNGHWYYRTPGRA